eukprot:CAMPEP_0117765978 /NCGR_PEP_ID=MMETSP0947-20121206/20513_1 /TAXON_ID=44440 /ORGANISM="Chattonella subsalsa, Strain CCMP2191" /LENGTH=163 /DNA_ID=CAMNT_0005588895 /DNA_START=173 /DNA_END=664 /DNA_ORIENTATION=-
MAAKVVKVGNEGNPEHTYDVTDVFLKIFCCPCSTETLLLYPEEAHLITKTPCAKIDKKFPYGELGNVEKSNFLCCHFLNASFSERGLAPGCYGIGKESFVNEIVTELKERMRARGDTGQIKRAEETVEMLKALTTRMDGIESKLDRVLQKLDGNSPIQNMMDR